MWIWSKRIALAVIAFLVAAQIIRPSRTNPPIDSQREIHAALPVDPAVASIFSRACNDCHSHRTVWPWYSGVAPVSWLVAYDVRQGRRKMNFSEWQSQSSQSTQKLLKEICTDVTEGEMPGRGYSLLHSEATLSAADILAVCTWSQSVSQSLADRRSTEWAVEDWEEHRKGVNYEDF